LEEVREAEEIALGIADLKLVHSPRRDSRDELEGGTLLAEFVGQVGVSGLNGDCTEVGEWCSDPHRRHR